MLILTRNIGQKVVINDKEVLITVVDVSPHNQVRLSFEADTKIKIHREEIYQRIKQKEQPQTPTIPETKHYPSKYNNPLRHQNTWQQKPETKSKIIYKQKGKNK